MENGALLSQENHNWFNSQSPAMQGYLNRRFQEYKACKVVLVDDLPTPIKVRPFEVRLKEPYNRTKMKNETRKMLEEIDER